MWLWPLLPWWDCWPGCTLLRELPAWSLWTHCDTNDQKRHPSFSGCPFPPATNSATTIIASAALSAADLDPDSPRITIRDPDIARDGTLTGPPHWDRSLVDLPDNPPGGSLAPESWQSRKAVSDPAFSMYIGRIARIGLYFLAQSPYVELHIVYFVLVLLTPHSFQDPSSGNYTPHVLG